MDEVVVPGIELPTDVVPLVPMRNVVLFPHVMVPVTVGRARSLAALAHAAARRTPLAVVLQKDASVDEPGAAALCAVGTLAQVVQQLRSEDQQVHAVCQGLQRIRVLGLVEGHPFLAARIERIAEAAPSTAAQALRCSCASAAPRCWRCCLACPPSSRSCCSPPDRPRTWPIWPPASWMPSPR
jgi:ATP-dependent Lon protease